MLHVFQIGPDKVIAESTADAWAVWCKHHGEKQEDYAGAPVRLLHADEVIVIYVENGPISDTDEPTRMTAAEWVEREGRGFLCSTEY